MKFFRFLKYFLCITFSFLVLSSPVFAGANVAVKGEGDEVPSYVRSNITGYNFHGEDLHLSSIAGAVARDADFSDVDLHGTTLTLSDLKGSNLNGIDLTDTLSLKEIVYAMCVMFIKAPWSVKKGLMIMHGREFKMLLRIIFPNI